MFVQRYLSVPLTSDTRRRASGGFDQMGMRMRGPTSLVHYNSILEKPTADIGRLGSPNNKGD
jgi:hypothetical protein